MKKKIAVLALVAVFVSVGTLTAQTKTDNNPAPKTEVKSTTPPCCDGKTTKCCKGKKAKCCKDKKAAEGAKCDEKSAK